MARGPGCDPAGGRALWEASVFGLSATPISRRIQAAVTDRLVSLCRQTPVGGRQIHDANIVATMLAYGERRLLTFNTADLRCYADRIEIE
jgi:predicted nucleic acid-binding protein